MRELFKETEHKCNLRNDHTFRTYNFKVVQCGTKILSFMGPKIWSLVPSNIKIPITLEIFTQNIWYWKPDNCTCRLCKTYIKSYSISFWLYLKKSLSKIVYMFFLSFFIIIILLELTCISQQCNNSCRLCR